MLLRISDRDLNERNTFPLDERVYGDEWLVLARRMGKDY